MTDRTEPIDAYRAELTRWASALAVGRAAEVQGDLAPGSLPQHVRRFVKDNLSKRCEKLLTQLEFVADAFADFDALLEDYVRKMPQAAFDTTSGDGERFLGWLEQSHPLTPEQQDHVACQRARHAVEAQGRTDRRGHLYFQELWTRAGRLGAELDTNPCLTVHLNPIRAWSRFVTPVLLEDEADLPADVLFFAVGNTVRTVVMDETGRAAVSALAANGPFTLDEWVRRDGHAQREGLIGLARDLAELGLVAFR